MAPPSRTQIKINALKRMVKEHELYTKDEAEMRANFEALKAKQPVDEYEVRRAQQVLEETRRVLPHVRSGIEQHLAAVRSLTGLKAEENAEKAEAIAAAESYLQSHPYA